LAKSTHDDVLDGALNIVKNGATQICVCSAQPTTYAEAVTTYMLAIKSDLTSGSFTGPANDTSGRKLTVNAQAAVPITNSGTALFIALCDVDDRLLEVTTCTSQALVAANTVTIPAFKIGFADPT
jgi:hypothetical protein